MAPVFSAILQFGEPGGLELAVVLLIAVILFGANAMSKFSRNVSDTILDAIGGDGPTRVSRQALMEIDDSEFEEFVSILWEGEGYATHLTGGGADRGIDVIANKEGETVVIEAKRYQDGNKVSAPTVQKAVGAREQFQADKAVIVTTSGFTEPAERAAADTGVELVDGREFEDRYNSLLERAESLD